MKFLPWKLYVCVATKDYQAEDEGGGFRGESRPLPPRIAVTLAHHTLPQWYRQPSRNSETLTPAGLPQPVREGNTGGSVVTSLEAKVIRQGAGTMNG